MTATRTSFEPVWRRIAVAAIAGYSWGAVTASIPAPSDPTVFWVGNLGVPYVVLPFLAGAWGFRALPAALVGAMSAGLAIAGFYEFHMVGHVTNMDLELPVWMTARDVVIHAYGRWFGTFLFADPGGIPWLSIGFAVGAVAGLVGYLWRVRDVRWAAVLVALLLMAEPFYYVVDHLLGVPVLPRTQPYALHAPNLVIWGVEAGLGLIAIAWLRRSRPSFTERRTT